MGEGEGGDPARGTAVARRTVDAAEVGTEAPRLWTVVINGGGSAERNYQSHLLHVRELVSLLEARGVARNEVAVFVSDGADPAPDLAVIDAVDDEQHWLIEGLPVARALRPEVYLRNTEVAGVALEPASKQALSAWLAGAAGAMRAGDTLLVYVTDHGWKNGADLSDNAIVMWGENLRVSELRRALDVVPDGVRVVLLMSQCFSGSFANLVYGSPAGIDGSVCGYFSAPAGRFAYGCYAENRGRDNVGHSFRFIEGLRLSRRFVDAHATVLLDDRTPDVPHRTSDHYLQRLLAGIARARGVAIDAVVDELLEQAWADELHYRPAFDEIDRLGRAYGSFGPRSLAELEQRSRHLPELRDELDDSAGRWRTALQELKRENFAHFLDASPDWREVAVPDFLDGFEPEEKAETLELLLADVHEFTATDTDRSRRLGLLRVMAREAAAASYRMEVRLGATLRMRMLLTRIAGQVYVDRVGTTAERGAFERLVACEDLSLGPRVRPLGRARLESPPYPPLDEELQLLATVLPGWLGLDYKLVHPAARASLGLADGAVVVSRVYPGSPAQDAGLEVGDIVLGPPGDYFTEPNRIREWVMTSLVDEIRTVHVLRDGAVRVFELRVGAPPS